MDGAGALVPGEVVGASPGSGRGRILHETSHGGLRPARPGPGDPFDLRRTVFSRCLDAWAAGTQAIHRSDHAPFFPARELEFIRSIVALVERPPSSGASATLPPRDSTNTCPSTVLSRQSSPLIKTSGLTVRIIFSARVSSNTTT